MSRSQLVFALATVFAVGAVTACGGSAGPTSSPTPIPSIGSPSGAASAVSDPEADQHVKEGVHAILVGLQSWATSQSEVHYPAQATAAVLDKYMIDPWPINPFTGTQMKPGDGRGDYEYEVATNRKSCTVTVRLSDGSTYTPQVLRIGS